MVRDASSGSDALPGDAMKCVGGRASVQGESAQGEQRGGQERANAQPNEEQRRWPDAMSCEARRLHVAAVRRREDEVLWRAKNAIAHFLGPIFARVQAPAPSFFLDSTTSQTRHEDLRPWAVEWPCCEPARSWRCTACKQRRGAHTTCSASSAASNHSFRVGCRH